MICWCPVVVLDNNLAVLALDFGTEESLQGLLVVLWKENRLQLNRFCQGRFASWMVDCC